MKVFAYSIHGFDRLSMEKAAAQKHELDLTELQLNMDTVELAKGFDSIAIFSNDIANKEVLEKLAKLKVKFIALRSVGYDHVDLKAAAHLKIKVANVPGYSPHAIAEHSVALLLSLIRKLNKANQLMNLQDFRLDELVGFNLHGKTVGIIGVGQIGYVFAKIMNAFGCRLLAHDPIKQPYSETFHIDYTGLEDLLEKSDIVSIYAPLNKGTKHMISGPQFEIMKKGAILVNTARGPIVDTHALVQYLENGKISGACLDVYEFEKGLYFHDHRNDILNDSIFSHLRSLQNVILTGHQAFLTEEAINEIAAKTIQNLNQWENAGSSENDLI